MAVVHALLPFVGGRVRDALFVQSLCEICEYARAADKPVENVAYNRSGCRQLADGCGHSGLCGSRRRGRTDEFALAALQVKRSADLVRDVAGVFVI